MSWQAQGWAWTITGVSPMAKLVALSLANHADPYGGNIRPGMPLVQRETCASEQSVRRGNSRADRRWVVGVGLSINGAGTCHGIQDAGGHAEGRRRLPEKGARFRIGTRKKGAK